MTSSSRAIEEAFMQKRTNLKILWLASLVSTLLFSQLACESKSKSRESIRGGRTGRSGTADTSLDAYDRQPLPGDNLPSIGDGPRTSNSVGQIYTLQNDQGTFQYITEYFVSSFLDPWGEDGGVKELGQVSGQRGSQTGIYFAGQVETSGRFNPQGSNQLSIDSGRSEATIIVWDSAAGQFDAANQKIPPIQINIQGNRSGTSIRGTISGNRAEVAFEDEFGTITFRGTFNAQFFEGDVLFDNKRYFDGQTPGAVGTFDRFFVATCGFFVCE